MIVDLAHASPKTVLDAIKVSRTPVLFSHTALLSTFEAKGLPGDMRLRLLTVEQASVIAQNGGVVGVWTHLCDNVQDYVHALRDMVNAIEADHVGIDTDMTSGKGLPQTNKAWPGLNEGFFYAVLAEMRRQKFAVPEIEKIAGGNYLRIFAASDAKA